jgi:hypothetical protein
MQERNGWLVRWDVFRFAPFLEDYHHEEREELQMEQPITARM